MIEKVLFLGSEQIVEILITATGKRNIVTQFTGKTNLVKERRADYSKAKQMLNWEPIIDVNIGLTELAKDIIDNPQFYLKTVN